MSEILPKQVSGGLHAFAYGIKWRGCTCVHQEPQKLIPPQSLQTQYKCPSGQHLGSAFPG